MNTHDADRAAALQELEKIPSALRILALAGDPDRMRLVPCVYADGVDIDMWWRNCRSLDTPLQVFIRVAHSPATPGECARNISVAVDGECVQESLAGLAHRLRVGYQAWLDRQLVGMAEWYAMVLAFVPEPAPAPPPSPVNAAGIERRAPLWAGAVGGACR